MITVDARAAKQAVEDMRVKLADLAERTAGYRWRGQHYRGAMAERRAQKRAEAEARAERTTALRELLQRFEAQR